MFRRLFIEENELIFDPSIIISEDIFFVMKAFINASVISVKGGYDYYYRVKRDDGKNLTQSQALESPYAIYYASQQVVEMIKNSSLSERYKMRWMKLYTERFLREHFREILSPLTDTTKLDAMYEYVVGAVGVSVLDTLSSEYEILVRLLEWRNMPRRQLFLKGLNTTSQESLLRINQKLYFKASDVDFYDASFLYRRLEYKISDVTIRKGLLIITMPIAVILNRRENLRPMLQLTNIQNKRVLFSDGSKVGSGKYVFEFDIRNALWVAEKDMPTYHIAITFKCGDTTIQRVIERRDIEHYTERLFAFSEERYNLRLKSRDDSCVDVTFGRSKYFAAKRLKYRFFRMIKKNTPKMLY